MAVPDPSSTLTQVVAQRGPEQQWIPIGCHLSATPPRHRHLLLCAECLVPQLPNVQRSAVKPPHVISRPLRPNTARVPSSLGASSWRNEIANYQLGVGVRACRQGGTHSDSLRLHWLCWRVLWPASSDGSCTTALTGLPRVRRADDNQPVPPHVALQARTHQHARMRITGHKVMTICISHIRSLLFCTYSAAPFIQERGCHPIGGVTTHEPPLTTSRVPLGQPRPVSLHGHPRLPKDTDALLKREGKKHKASIQ